MSIIDDDETLNLFIEEAKDNLNDLEKDLLAIEAAGADADSELVNRVFRAIHSIKGGAGFFGLDKIKDLSHDMENILNMLRNREILPTSPLINALLAAEDLLNEMILDAKNSNETDISECAAALKAALGAPVETPVAKPAETKTEGYPIGLPGQEPVFTLRQAELEEAFRQRDYLYFATYDRAEDLEAKGLTIPALLQSLQSTGLVLKQHEGKTDLSILFATVLEPDIIQAQIQVPAERLLSLDPSRFGLTAPAVIESKVPQLETTPEPVEPAPKKEKEFERKSTPQTDGTLRVNVKALDSLMTLAGELVLTRNQMLQNVSTSNMQGIESSSQRLNLITSDLQEAIMSTRMQPIGIVFHKFKRIVRDLSQDLGKEIELQLEGEEVDLDKTIIEAIADPLTHLVRNSVDHGIEAPSERTQKGKALRGTVRLSAFHEAGQVIIEINDDGKGIDPLKVREKARSMGLVDWHQLEGMSEKELVKLIFHPGLSLAKEITDISGRGVGMDVVYTNLTKIGGVIDIDTQVDRGTTFRIKLPLTLAIIPTLLVSVEEERYAIPQVNLVELVRVPAAQVKKRIERIGGALVMRLRGNLLPLVRLRDVLGIPMGSFEHPETGAVLPDRRDEVVDRRAAELPLMEEHRQKDDRRYHSASAINIVVVTAGEFHYGIIVDKLLDSEEIVVKPLGRHLSDCKGYAGATIQGDGRVALILDVAGISNMMKLATVNEAAKEKALQNSKEQRQDAQSLLIVRNAPKEQFAIPLGLVSRIERINRSSIECTGGQMAMKYRGENLALFSIEDVAHVSPREDLEHLYVIVFPVAGREVGIVVSQILDIVDINLAIDEITFRQTGILGSAIILGETTLLVDLYGIVSTLKPEWTVKPSAQPESGASILLVEDSQFFLNQIKGFIEDAGYPVFTATDGLEALDVLQAHGGEIGMVVTDIEMPNLDGLELTKRIRASAQWSALPIIAVTSIAGEAAEQRGLDAGIDDYLIKLDREKILERISHHLAQ